MEPESASSLLTLSGLSLDDMENRVEANYLVMACTIVDKHNEIRSHALIASEATGYAFIDKAFAKRHNFPLFELKELRPWTVIDGRPVSSGGITHITKIGLSITNHDARIPAFVTTLGGYHLTVGIPWLKHHNVKIDFASNSLTFESEYCLKNSVKDVTMAYGIEEELPHFLLAYAAQCALGHKVLDKDEVLQILPKQYHEFLPLFLEKTEDQLPPHGRFDHEIPLHPGFVPPFRPIYSLSPPELLSLYEWLDDNLDTKFIRKSSSPAASPILFVKKTESSLRLCVDYRGVNEGTIKNRYALPLVKETFMQLSRAKIFKFTKLDIHRTYNLIRMRAGEEWKRAFRTRYGLLEFLVMPFGLTNAPATFQAYIKDALRRFLDRFCTASLDDILIYSENEEQHIEHVKQILEALTKAGLQVKPQKCEFHTNNVKYLGFIITTEGLRMDPAKITTIIEWPIPKKLHDIRSFLGFGNLYRRFIQDYSHLARRPTQLTKKGTPLVWSDPYQAAFERFKEAFTTVRIRIHFDFDKEIVVETDASNIASAGILSQQGPDGLLHLLPFFSKKLTPAECNYDIYDKELIAVVSALEEWRGHLVGRHVTIRSDHQNLRYFTTKRLFNQLLARWSELLHNSTI